MCKCAGLNCGRILKYVSLPQVRVSTSRPATHQHQPDQARRLLNARISWGAGVSQKRGVKWVGGNEEGWALELRRDGSKCGCRRWPLVWLASRAQPLHSVARGA